jgi:hypothetical protein
MLQVKCKTDSELSLIEMLPFQGELKQRSNQDIEDLKESLLTEGLLMPFAIWKNDQFHYILDGHGRYEAIVKIALQDPSVLAQAFPVVLINAETEQEARKALLQIVSTYGKITKKGVITFSHCLQNYKAPVIRTSTPKIRTPRVLSADDKIVVRIKVTRDKVDQLTSLLKQVSGIEVF